MTLTEGAVRSVPETHSGYRRTLLQTAWFQTSADLGEFVPAPEFDAKVSIVCRFPRWQWCLSGTSSARSTWLHFFSNAFHSIPSCRIAARIVPSLRSRLPQSSNDVTRWVIGLNHLRWEPPPRRGNSWHPKASNLRVTSCNSRNGNQRFKPNRTICIVSLIIIPTLLIINFLLVLI